MTRTKSARPGPSSSGQAGGAKRSSLTGSTWKLVVSPLNGPGETVEASVEAENWLSALRLARKELGEEGGMPPGASCAMSATGEVTILDAAQRLRYVLTRQAISPVADEPASSVRPTEHARRAAVAPAAGVQNHNGNPMWPTPAAQTPRRSATIAYSPEESAEARRQLVAARPAQPGLAAQESREFTPSRPPKAPSIAPGAPTSPQLGESSQGLPSPAQSAAAHQAPPAAAKRSSTVSYSAEESADFRRLLQAAAQARSPQAQDAAAQPQNGPTPHPATQQPLEAAPAPSFEAPKPPASSGRKATVAYLQSPFTPGGELVTLQARDEAPSPSSPLTYRERSYFAPKPLEPSRLEALMRSELDTMMRELAASPRGQFVNLAVFDHAFQSRPQRPPLATLQWKDWRGAPIFSLAGAQPLPSWQPSPSGAPVTTSFAPPVPAASATPAAQVEVIAPIAAPPVQSPVMSAPVAPAPVIQRAAPVSPIVTPARGLQEGVSEFGAEPTGDQDRRLAIAFEASQDLYFLGTPVEGLELAVKLLSDLVPCEAVSGCIYDINTDEFRFVALTGPGATERRAEAVPSNEGLLAAAVHSGQETFVASNVESDPRYDAAIDGRVGLSVDTVAYLLLQKGDNLLGVLQLINRKHRSGFSDADMAVAGYLASQVAEFLQSRRSGRR